MRRFVLASLPTLAVLALANAAAPRDPAPHPAPAARDRDAQQPTRFFTTTYRGAHYAAVEIDPTAVRIQAFWKDQGGRPFSRLDRLQAWLARQNDTLLVAMNGGIFETDGTPLGLLVSRGRIEHALSRCPAPPPGGNFCLPPNGVFFVKRDGTVGIRRSEGLASAFADSLSAATQSGPMLVENGALTEHYQSADTLPAWTGKREQRAREFSPRNKLHTRNAVCIGPNGKVFFVKTKNGVRGDPFARYLRDELRCRDALYLDGNVSALHVPGPHDDPGSGLVTMIAVTAGT